jgi:hypothetical protein
LRVHSSKDRNDGAFPPRVSSLPGSPNEVVTKPSVASWLARPTKASAARAAANAPLNKSGTVTSVKKFGSRLSSILPIRRRSSLPGLLDKPKGFAANGNSVASSAAVKKDCRSVNPNYAHSINGRAFLPTYGNSCMKLRCSEFVRAGPDGGFMVRTSSVRYTLN